MLNYRYKLIYKKENVFGLIMGEKVYILSDGIKDIKENVKIGYKKVDILDDYSFGINTEKKEWKIRDTGQKYFNEVIASGKYEEGFEKSLKPFIRIIRGR